MVRMLQRWAEMVETGEPMVSRAARLRRKPEFTRATFLDLLFDVVFVLVLTQLGRVLGDVNWNGVVHTLILLFALSSVWAVTAEECNRFDPRCRPIQLLVLGALLGTLVMAAAVPEAFGVRGL